MCVSKQKDSLEEIQLLLILKGEFSGAADQIYNLSLQEIKALQSFASSPWEGEGGPRVATGRLYPGAGVRP